MILYKQFRACTTPSVVSSLCFYLAEFSIRLYNWKLFLSLSGLIVVTLWPGLDVEFHMRRIKYLFESLRILYTPKRIRERGKHSDRHNKPDFLFPDGKFVMKIGRHGQRRGR